MISTEVIALNKNLTCLPGYDRVGYNCIERSKSLKSNIIYSNSCLLIIIYLLNLKKINSIEN
jgi:hypothetical protein